MEHDLEQRRQQDAQDKTDFSSEPHPIADLPTPHRRSIIQRGAGNAAIQRAVQRTVNRRKAARLAGKIGGLPLSQPGDASEREAHQVAKQVRQMPAPSQDQPVQRAALESSPQRPAGLEAPLASGGQPLDDASRAFFEPRLGADLSQVRVHADDQAARSAVDLNALAYTVGKDVVFAPGQYAPHISSGQEILAHELAHVIQQDGVKPEAGGQSEKTGTGGRGTQPHIHRTGGLMVQRWDSPEHVDLGDAAAGLAAGFITLESHDRDFPQRAKPMPTWPAEWQTLYASATADQQRAITKGLTYGEIVALSGDFYADFNALNRAPLREIYDLIPLIRGKASTTQLQTATGGRYLALAKKNESHFSNVTPGKSNRETWRSMHIEAIHMAKTSQDNLAWAINAAADHFLTDAFSGGHIRTPRAALMGKMGGLGDVESKILHDLDNEHGVDVTNNRGDKWTAYGDDMLHDPRNADNQRLALEAVQLSRTDIANAIAQRGGYPEPDAHTLFSAEQLIPCPVDPTRDRWTGRDTRYKYSFPKGVERVEDDYTRTRERVIRSEAPGVAAELVKDDDQVRAWVNQQSMTALQQQPHAEKVRMIKVLYSGLVTNADMEAIKRICRSVTSKTEADYIRGEVNFVYDLDRAVLTAAQKRAIFTTMP